MFIIAVIFVFLLVVSIYFSMRKQKLVTLIKPREQINEFYKSIEGEFKVIGYKDEFIVTKNENLEFLVINGQIVASRDKRIGKEFVYYEVKQRLIKLIKDVVLALVNCVKIIFDKNSSKAQKADSITKILSTTVTAIAMELLFEYLEKQFALSDFLMEPLQVIVTILLTNIIMLVLNKADLFDIQYGLLVANIGKLIDEENQKYISSSKELLELGIQEYEKGVKTIQLQIKELTQSIETLDVYKKDAKCYLEGVSDIFNMGVDFNAEWEEFVEYI